MLALQLSTNDGFWVVGQMMAQRILSDWKKDLNDILLKIGVILIMQKLFFSFYENFEILFYKYNFSINLIILGAVNNLKLGNILIIC